jgi:putative ABC transport system substrate-binding protein
MNAWIDRREFVLLAAASLAAPQTLLAQPATRVYRIALLNDGDESTRQKDWQAFRGQLDKLGLRDGKNLSIDWRHARGRSDLLPKLAAELVATKPDVIVSPGTPASHAAKLATSAIPIVFISAGDPVGTGLVPSLSRPGSNITGVSVVTTEISQKSIELLQELSPGIQRIAYLGDPSNPAFHATKAPVQETARRLKMSIVFLDGAEKAELERTFSTIQRERVQGLYVDSAGRMLTNRDAILEFVARKKLPTVYGRHDYTDAGGLLSYETDRQLTFVRGADLVHRILQGAKPADLPVEQTSSFRMVLNMKTARTQGITVPAALRVRADEVIE